MVEQKFGIEIFWREIPGITKPRFEAAVRIELQKVLRSEAGRAIAASLRWHTKTKKAVLLMPYEGEGCNAQEDAVSRDRPLESVVLFSPHLLHGTPCSKEGGKATLPHERLFHELVHSLRRISGHNRPHRLSGPLVNYGNSEEFIAVLATNIFLADVTNPQKTGLRSSYLYRHELEQDYSGSFLFFKNGIRAFNEIEAFCNNNRGFTGMLARVRGAFNPVAAFYQNRRKAFEMAVEADAEGVFQEIVPQDYVKDDRGNWVRLSPFAGPGTK